MDNLFDQIVENAIDFLETSVEFLENKPKYSIINFCSSIELFLKARLAAEHWSLIVTNKQFPDYTKVKNGEFQSVNLNEAVEKLKKTVRSGLTDDEHRAFKKIFNHRNKAVHFYHEAHTSHEKSEEKIQLIVKEQLNAWFYLYSIITNRWDDVFSEKLKEIEAVNQKLKSHHEFLRIVYEKYKSTIYGEEAKGVIYSTCPSCSFHSMRHSSNELEEFYLVECNVCDFNKEAFHSQCPDCNHDIYFIGEGHTECENCALTFSPDFIAEIIYDGPSDYEVIKEGATSLNDINCEECWESESIVQTIEGNFRCTNCFESFDNIYQCEWCGSFSTTENEYSYLSGCSACEGRSGWKDD